MREGMTEGEGRRREEREGRVGEHRKREDGVGASCTTRLYSREQCVVRSPIMPSGLQERKRNLAEPVNAGTVRVPARRFASACFHAFLRFPAFPHSLRFQQYAPHATACNDAARLTNPQSIPDGDVPYASAYPVRSRKNAGRHGRPYGRTHRLPLTARSAGGHGCPYGPLGISGAVKQEGNARP